MLELLNWLPAIAALLLSGLFFHIGMPNARSRFGSMKLWLLAVALALIGARRLTMTIGGDLQSIADMLGLYALLGYAVMRFVDILRRGTGCKWWQLRERDQ